MSYANGCIWGTEDSAPHGNGVMTYAHGDRYEGQFVRGVPYGRGKYTVRMVVFIEGVLLYLTITNMALLFPRRMESGMVEASVCGLAGTSTTGSGGKTKWKAKVFSSSLPGGNIPGAS